MNAWIDYWTLLTERFSLLVQPWLPSNAPALDQWLSEMLGSVPWVMWAGLALWLAMRVADMVQRAGGMRTTAFWWSGALLALVGISWMHTAQVIQLTWVFELALGWMLFSLGQRIDTRWLLRNKALAATALLEFIVTWAVVSGLLMQLGLSTLPALLVGVIAAHSSPVILASFMPQWRPDGQISARALHLGGLSTLLAALCLPLLMAFGEAWQQSTAASATQAAGGMNLSGWQALPFIQRSGWELVQPLLLLLLAMLVGVGMGKLLTSASRPAQGASAEASWPASETIRLAAAVCVCAGLAQWWGAPAWAACLALGLGVRPVGHTLARVNAPTQGLQEGITALAQMSLFAFSGALIVDGLLRSASRFSDAPAAIGMMMALVALMAVLRLFSKLLVCTLTARWAGLRWQQGFALGLMLQPLSMTGLALLLMALPVLMATDALLAASLMLALALSDWLAPTALHRLLKRCGEIAEPAPEIAGLNTRSSTQATQVDTSRIEPALDERQRLQLHDQAGMTSFN
jgi:Kef-type K+ transport system membrane component KefB